MTSSNSDRADSSKDADTPDCVESKVDSEGGHAWALGGTTVIGRVLITIIYHHH